MVTKLKNQYILCIEGLPITPKTILLNIATTTPYFVFIIFLAIFFYYVYAFFSF